MKHWKDVTFMDCVDDFSSALSTVKSPTELTHHVCQLGMAAPRDRDFHPMYNLSIHLMLKNAGLIPAIRRVMLTDMKQRRIFADPSSCQQLLDNVVTGRPNKAWITGAMALDMKLCRHFSPTT